MTQGSLQRGLASRLFRTTVVCLATFLFLQLVSLYLSWPKQMMLGAASILLGLMANRCTNSRVVTLALMLVSLTATVRYGWWRVALLVDFFTDPSNHRFGFDSAFMLILISAEAYTILIMVLGYMQTAWPLHRTPILLPNDERAWPDVDVVIPTYNEPLSLVRYTALAAIQIDYPPEKLHVYILDDGTREDFREFAQEAGVGYITRVEHNHAKAGNINHALTKMTSPYVAIFDCDHVPTRSFLQMTLGWMLADAKLAMLQTPHHFYSPDPFERNLLQYKTIPNEGELFYGIVQDGNDLWNATFFCGSCALIRRSALEEVGGIAVETVTEDAHTSLRMQKLGYNTAYINIPQAAGLATESLAAHVGQRIRWARGMIQILRTDNPLLARGMKFTQRLCYLNAMLHFLYAVPRLVFLCAPLVYMLLGKTIIPGYWVAILAYSLPHLILSSLTNSRIQGYHRHSFWNEIYEAVLAPYILAPTLLALINPRLGKFNVTDKGSTLSDTHFDTKIATPTGWLLFLNFLGLAIAPWRLFVQDPQHPGTVIMNLVWILFNMVILGVAAAVAHEQKQRRGAVRIEAKIPIRLHMPDGRELDGMTINMSASGAAVKLTSSERLSVRDRFRVSFPDHAGDEEVTATAVGLRNGEIRLAFLANTIAEQETLTRALYSRADAWLQSAESKEVDRPLVSLGRVMRLSVYGIYQLLASLLPEKSRTSKQRVARTAAAVLAACFFLLSCQQLLGSDRSAQNQLPAAPDSSTMAAEGLSGKQQSLTLADMGAGHIIEMHGPHSWYSAQFNLSSALVPRVATLRLRYSIDSGLDPRVTSLNVELNGTTIATLRPTPAFQSGTVNFIDEDLQVPAGLLVRTNNFTFEFSGSGVMERESQAGSAIRVRISPQSTLQVSGYRLRLHNDLSQLPLPFFDPDLQSATVVPFVFLSAPDAKALEASGAVASWFGLLARSRPVRFSASIGDIPAGDVVVFSDHRDNLPVSLQLPAGSGPVVALRNNPSDPYGSVLIVAGSDEDQLLAAARTLALLKNGDAPASSQGLAPGGDTLAIPQTVMPAPRLPEDAPRWLPLKAASPLVGCQSQTALQTDGSRPVPLYFHLPPDLFYGERQVLKLRLNYRYSAFAAGPGAALRVVVNGTLLNEIPLANGADTSDNQRLILLPVAAMRPFGNTILFSFDFGAGRKTIQQGSPAQPNGEILCNSSLDLHGLSLWTRMPNLQLFANAGFPFTRMADLSQTTVVLPANPTAAEIELYLGLMGHFGAQSGYPALRVTVAGPSTVISDNSDYLVIGTASDQPAFTSLNPLLPVAIDPAGFHLTHPGRQLPALANKAGNWWPDWLHATAGRNPFPIDDTVSDAMVEEIESPSSPQRSFVLIALRDGAAADPFSTAFVRRSQSDDMTHAVSLLRNGQFHSYSVDGATYHLGDISWFATMRIWLTQYFLLLLVTVTALSFLLARWMREWLMQLAGERLKLAEVNRTAQL